ncbi:MAG: cytochrome c [Roseovarius sp.]|uniref:c-type cytochrome n=1 Tax=Roseobacteraceae TaxID=2854170 RepID=UPI0032EB6DA5
MKHAMIAALLAAAACTPQDSPSVSRDTGRTLFAENCASCHGPAAKGNGPLAAGLKTSPADLTRIAARRNGVWPRLEVMAIVDGYTKRTNPRDDMPVIPALTGGPLVDFDTGNGTTRQVPARLVAVVTYLESLQSPPPTSYVP